MKSWVNSGLGIILTHSVINEERVSKAIKSMKGNKAAGCDSLISSFIKKAEPSIVAPLEIILTESLEK